MVCHAYVKTDNTLKLDYFGAPDIQLFLVSAWHTISDITCKKQKTNVLYSQTCGFFITILHQQY